MAEQVCAELSPRAEKAEVVPSARCTAGQTIITGSRINISKAVRHLILNAITFNRPGGKAEVEVTHTEDNTTVAVRDTGIGIPAELPSGPGKPFYQVEDHLTRKTGGLGLATARHVAEAHHDSLTISSAPGQGAAFTITFSNTDPCLPETKE